MGLGREKNLEFFLNYFLKLTIIHLLAMFSALLCSLKIKELLLPVFSVVLLHF